MGIVYWLKSKSIVRRIVHTPLVSIVRELIQSAYGRYVSMLARIGKDGPIAKGERSRLLLVTIAFNHEGLIRKQIEMVRQHVGDEDFQHIIIDNSSRKDKRRAIKDVCHERGVEYVAVPRYLTWLTWSSLFYPSYSHGGALNWAYLHVIKPRQPEFFVFLDHDIIPAKTYCFIDSLGSQDFYGVDRLRECGWYLWPGFSIFRFAALANRQADFSPVYVKHCFLDAGGRNFLSLYSNYYRTDLRFASIETRRIRVTPSLRTLDDIFHNDCIQVVDNAWIHVINASNYTRIKGRDEVIDNMIDKIDAKSL